MIYSSMSQADKDLIERGILPEIDTKEIYLQKNEICHFAENAELVSERIVRDYSYNIKGVKAPTILGIHTRYGKCQKVITGEHVEADFMKSMPHAWNIVKLNGKAYHVDATWGVCTSEPQGVNYAYLNLDDREISLDHKASMAYPKCNHRDLDYYQNKGLDIDNPIHLKNFMKNGIKTGASMVECRIVPGSGKMGFTGEEDIEEVIKEAADRAGRESGRSVRYQLSYDKNKKTVRFYIEEVT